jgi:prepilin peptidase CpaA
MALQMIVTYVWAALLLAASAQDLRSLRISNKITLPTLILSLLYAVSFSDRPLWEHFASLLLTFFAGLLLFKARWFGGGDVKLLIAVSAFFSVFDLPRVFIFISIAGAAVTAVIYALKVGFTIDQRERANWKSLKKGSVVPYGIAISAGAIVAAWPLLVLIPERNS